MRPINLRRLHVMLPTTRWRRRWYEDSWMPLMRMGQVCPRYDQRVIRRTR